MSRKQVSFLRKPIRHTAGAFLCAGCGEITEDGVGMFMVEPQWNRSHLQREFYCVPCMEALPEKHVLKLLARGAVKRRD